MDNLLPFSHLKENEFEDFIGSHSKLNLEKDEISKSRNLIFNPFTINNRGNTFLTLNNELDPDYNYYHLLLNYPDECDYHYEDTFNTLVKEINNEHDFSIIHLNIRSIVNKYDDFKAYITQSLKYKFSVIGITETWLHKDNEKNFPLPQFSFTRRSRENKQADGVGLYVNEAYQFKERDDLAVNADDVMESHFIELTAKPNNILIGVIYRPPNDKLNAFKENLAELLHKLDSQNKKCFLMGDFNIDLLKSEENRHVNDFLNQMFSSSFYPLISRPTRVTKSSATLIDNIYMYVNYIEENYKSGILFSDLSDHLPVFQITNRITNDSKPLIRTGYRQINKNNVQRLLEKLEKENWHDVYKSKNTHEAYNIFYNKLYNTYDKCIPYKKHSIAKNGKIPWITKGILISRKTKK